MWLCLWHHRCPHCEHTQRHPTVNVALRRNTTTCLLHGMWVLWTLNTDFKPFRCWNEFFSPLHFLKQKSFAVWKKIAAFNKWMARYKKVHGRRNESHIILTAFQCCYKSILRSLPSCSYSSFFVLVHSIHACAWRANTKPVFMFLFVTKPTMNDCVGSCVSIWRAWLSKLNEKNLSRTSTRWFEHFFCLFTHSNVVFIYICYVHCIVDRYLAASSLISVFSVVYFEVIVQVNLKKVFEIELLFQTRRKSLIKMNKCALNEKLNCAKQIEEECIVLSWL